MLAVLFLISLGLGWIIFATIQDIKETEVADWISFSLIIFALGFRFFYSLFVEQGFSFFYQGLIGLGIFFILGNLFYYFRLFAGGDAKLMIALGTILPFSNNFIFNLEAFFLFILIFFIIGAIYGIIWSLVLVFKNLKLVRKGLRREFEKKKNLIYFLMFAGLFFMIVGFSNFLIFYFGILIFIFPILFIYAKAIDESILIKRINVKNLREGDWIYKDLKVGRNVIKVNWEGLSLSDIKQIQKKYNLIQIRQGIAFVPVFLISFILYGILLGTKIFGSLIFSLF